MATTLFEHQPYDPARERRKRARTIAAAIVVLLLAGLAWWFRYWPEEHRVDKFFAALQTSEYQGAYALWVNDPEWKQHEAQYARYSFQSFYQDWGPGGEYGTVKSYRIDGAAKPPARGDASGVVVVVTVNDRPEKLHLWVEKSTKALSFSPY